MSSLTRFLGLLKKDPTTDGNDTFNIDTMINQPFDKIDAAAEKPFYLASAVYDPANNRIACTLGPGIAELFNGNARVIVNTDIDTVYYITTPAINTTYYLYLQQDGTFIANTSGIVPSGAVLLWQIATEATVDALTLTDRRYQVSGAGTVIVAHQAENATQAHLAKNIAIQDTGQHFIGTEVETALSELFTSVSDGKTGIATAITGKGGTASGSDSFSTLASAITNGLMSGIKSIQQGIYSNSGTLSITPVDPNNSILIIGNASGGYNGAQDRNPGGYAYLSSDGASIVFSSMGTAYLSQGWVLIEFKPGAIKSIQRGHTSVSNSPNPNLISITAATDMDKTMLVYNGEQGYSQSTPYNYGASAYLYSASQIAFVPMYPGLTLYNCIISWQVIEFN